MEAKRRFKQHENTRDKLQTNQEIVMFDTIQLQGPIFILPDVLAEVNSDTVHQFLISHLGMEVLSHAGHQVPSIET